MFARKGYLPALGFEFLTPLYDPLVRLTLREAAIKACLLRQARIRPDDLVLDIGCGTGTLLLMQARQGPSSRAVGLDGDGRILGLASRKARAAARPIVFVQALAGAIPLPDACCDRVLSSLMLHHLTRQQKAATLGEALRVLRPGGELHVADWGRPHTALMAGLSWIVRLTDGWERTADNVRGRLPALFQEAGFQDVAATTSFATVFGTLQLYQARRPAGSGEPSSGHGETERSHP